MDSTTAKTHKIPEKYNDFWAKHRLGTRISLVSFVLVYILTALLPFVWPALSTQKDIPSYDSLLSTTSETAFWAFAVVTVGANTLTHLADVWLKVKGGANKDFLPRD